MTIIYKSWLLHAEDTGEITIGEYQKLQKAMLAAKLACRDYGKADWDWIVDKYQDGELINSRSSLGFQRYT
jgi:hypothetical protein